MPCSSRGTSTRSIRSRCDIPAIRIQRRKSRRRYFVILARKSRHLGRRVILSGWLYQTARLTAVTYVRSVIRRARREQEAHMQSVVNEKEPEVWPEIAPLLDAAMAGLNEADRHAVVLRYFDGKSLKEVGAALGSNEEAAKKRVSCALEKLRIFFAKRGVSSTTAAIAGAISANSVQAAPVAVATSVGAVAMAKGVAASSSTSALIEGTLKLMTWTKIKIAALCGAAALIVTVVPLVAMQTAHSVVSDPGKRDARVERYEFQAAPARYKYPPAAPRPMEVISSPEFPGERLLSAEFSWRGSPNFPSIHSLRVAVSDGQGNAFDPIVTDNAGFAEDLARGYWVGSAPIFPRRGKEVHLRLLEDQTIIAEFKIPNPAPGPYPTWTPSPLPTTSSKDGLEVTLAKFAAYQTSPEISAKHERYPRTECVFTLRESGRATVDWTPVVTEVSDATGNHWRAWPNRFSAVDGEKVRSVFSGASGPANRPGNFAWSSNERPIFQKRVAAHSQDSHSRRQRSLGTAHPL